MERSPQPGREGEPGDGGGPLLMRGAQLLGDIDTIVSDLCDRLGWGAELEALMQAGVRD